MCAADKAHILLIHSMTCFKINSLGLHHRHHAPRSGATRLPIIIINVSPLKGLQ